MKTLALLLTGLSLSVAAAQSAPPASPVISGKALVDEAKAETQQVSVDAFKQLMANDNTVILDVRTQAEFDQGHVPGAIWAPRGKLEFLIDDHADAQTTVLLYCRSGSRSALANQTLTNMGYTQVYDLTGGYKAWAKQK